jgi:hypothetical protein
MRYSARPGRNSVFPPPSPEDWPFSRTPRMETCVVSPYRSPVPPRPGAPGCSRYGTAGSMAQIKEIGKEYFPIMGGMTSAELKFARRRMPVTFPAHPDGPLQHPKFLGVLQTRQRHILVRDTRCRVLGTTVRHIPSRDRGIV